MKKTIEKEVYEKLLADGMKVSIINVFVKYIQQIDNLETLKKIKKELYRK